MKLLGIELRRSKKGAVTSTGGTTPPIPSVELTVEPATIEKGKSATLRWTSGNAALLSITPRIGVVEGDSGSLAVMPLESTTYNITALGPGGVNKATACVTVIVPPPPVPTVALAAEPNTVEKGQPAMLIWVVSGEVTNLDLQPGIGKVEVGGSKSVTPTESTTYILTATGPGGVVTATAAVTVTVPTPAPTPEPPEEPSLEDLRKELAEKREILRVIREEGRENLLAPAKLVPSVPQTVADAWAIIDRRRRESYLQAIETTKREIEKESAEYTVRCSMPGCEKEWQIKYAPEAGVPYTCKEHTRQFIMADGNKRPMPSGAQRREEFVTSCGGCQRSIKLTSPAIPGKPYLCDDCSKRAKQLEEELSEEARRKLEDLEKRHNAEPRRRRKDKKAEKGEKRERKRTKSSRVEDGTGQE